MRNKFKYISFLLLFVCMMFVNNFGVGAKEPVNGVCEYVYGTDLYSLNDEAETRLYQVSRGSGVNFIRAYGYEDIEMNSNDILLQISVGLNVDGKACELCDSKITYIDYFHTIFYLPSQVFDMGGYNVDPDTYQFEVQDVLSNVVPKSNTVCPDAISIKLRYEEVYYPMANIYSKGIRQSLAKNKEAVFPWGRYAYFGDGYYHFFPDVDKLYYLDDYESEAEMIADYTSQNNSVNFYMVLMPEYEEEIDDLTEQAKDCVENSNEKAKKEISDYESVINKSPVLKNGINENWPDFDNENYKNILEQYTINNPYTFDSCELDVNSIQNDINTIKKFLNGEIVSCLNKVYASEKPETGTEYNGIFQYLEYDDNFSGKYAEGFLIVLESLVENRDEINELNCTNQTTNEIISELSIEDGDTTIYCSDYDRIDKFAGMTYEERQKKKEECIEKALAKNMELIDCSILSQNGYNSSNLNNLSPSLVESLYDKYSETCASAQDKAKCIYNLCVGAKQNPDSVIDDVPLEPDFSSIDDITDDMLGGLVDLIGSNIISSSSALCDTLNTVLGGYIILGLKLIRIAGILLVVGLTAMDAMKTFSSFKEDEQKKFFDKLVKRLICIVILFLIPIVVNFLVKLILTGFECSFYP